MAHKQQSITIRGASEDVREKLHATPVYILEPDGESLITLSIEYDYKAFGNEPIPPSLPESYTVTLEELVSFFKAKRNKK